MDKSNWISNYENIEKFIENAVKKNKEFTHAAFFSLGLASVGSAVAASSRLEPILAGGVAAAVTGLVMGAYFFISKGKNNEIIDAKQRLLDKLYKLMPEQDKDFIESRSILTTQNVIESIQTIREKSTFKNNSNINSSLV